MDYGGVLTVPVGDSFALWERQHRVDPGAVYRILLAASDDEDGGPIGALERGETSVEEFDELVRRLLQAAGHEVPSAAILDGLFAGMVPDGALWDAVRRARHQGVRTGLLSNSWGLSAYPREQLADHFDVTVISGEVGLRKPDPTIFHHAVERLGVEPLDCAFVDDNERNVVAAREVGMFAIRHDGDDARTVAALEDFLGVPLADASHG